MKMLQLSSIVLLLPCLFACTKPSSSIDEQVQQNRSDRPVTIHLPNVDPVLVVNFNPTPAVEGQPVTVTAGFSGAQPDCGKLQLFMKPKDGEFVKITEDILSTTVHSVSYTFSPELVGDDAYEFKAHYIPQGCDGFSEVHRQGFFLDVIAACNGLDIKGVASAETTEQAGVYLFTVNYTVKTCGIEYDLLKTQGGVTAWTSQVEATTEGAESWEVGNSDHKNTITKWEETQALTGNIKTYTVKFRKAWSGSGPVELTGQWSVKATLNGVQVDVAEFAPIVYMP